MSNKNGIPRTAVSLLALVLSAGCGGEAGLPAGAMEPNIEALPSLVQSLKHRDPAARTRAAVSIGRMGPIAKEAVPALTATLKDRDVSVRAARLTRSARSARLRKTL